MDTVTEARMAIALAREGGIGIVHRNLSIADQVGEVDKVKRSESGMIVEPLTLPPDALVADALALMERYHISGVPITDGAGRLVGILTNRDLRFEKDMTQPVSALMTSEGLVTAPVGTTLAEAEGLLHRHRIEKLPVVDADGRAQGPDHRQGHPEADRVPARRPRTRRGGCASAPRSASGPTRIERAQALVAAGADVLVVDTAHGHSRGVVEMVAPHHAASRGEFELIAGNIATGEAAEALIDAGADAVKVGIGPGIDLHDPGRRRRRRSADHRGPRRRRGRGPPRRAGHLPTAGSSPRATSPRRSPPAPTRVMLGSILAGTDESPGDVVYAQGERYKEYRGMGSLGAMKARGFSKDRYFQGDVEDVEKLVPEGIEGRVPYKGAARRRRAPAGRRPAPGDGLLRRRRRSRR